MGCPVRRGDIFLIDLEPTQGNEANKQRPAVLVSNDRVSTAAARSGRGVVTVVPVTSNIDRIYRFQTRLPADATSLRTDSKAQAEQVRSVSVQRLGRVLGRVPPPLMAELDDASRLHLQL